MIDDEEGHEEEPPVNDGKPWKACNLESEKGGARNSRNPHGAPGQPGLVQEDLPHNLCETKHG